MKKLIFVIFSIISFEINALSADSLKKLVVLNQTQFSFGSSHLNKKIFNKLYFGGKLNDDDKGKINTINQLQRSGLELDLNFGSQFYINEKIWYVNFQNIITTAGQYEQGLFDLFFRGNSELNQEISLTKTAFHFRNHHLFHFGKFQKFGRVGITLGSINQEYNIRFGENNYVDLTDPYQWNIMSSPDFFFIENTSDFLQKNGNSLGFDLEISNSNYEKALQYNLAIYNLGAILLHNNLQKISYDTNFTYSGLSLDQILNTDSSDNLLNDFKPQIDSLNRLIITPFQISATVNYQKHNFNYYTGVFYRYNSQYLPKVYLGMNYTIKNKLILGGVLSYGGYTKLQIGIDSEIQFQKFKAKLIIQNFTNFIPPMNRSFGVFLNLSYCLI